MQRKDKKRGENYFYYLNKNKIKKQKNFMDLKTTLKQPAKPLEFGSSNENTDVELIINKYRKKRSL